MDGGSRFDTADKAITASSFEDRLAGEIGALRRYARALQHDAAAADDLVQECLCRALTKSRLWHEGTDLRAWLFTMLHNLHISEVRRAARRKNHVAVEDVASTLAVAAEAPSTMRFRDLERVIASLPAAWQQSLLLVGLEGREYREVAAILGIPIGTVRSRLARSRDRLRGLIADEAAAPTRDFAGRTAAERPDKPLAAGDPGTRHPARGGGLPHLCRPRGSDARELSRRGANVCRHGR
jgi:RNA polymerase sigma-70 factor, ECF subfamily